MASPFLPHTVKDKLLATAQQRLLIWQFAAREIHARPLWGYGLDSAHALERESPPSVFSNGHPVMSQHTHDGYLQIWMELRAIGAALAFGLGLQLFGLIECLPALPQAFAWAGVAADISLWGTTGFAIWEAWWIAGQIMAAFIFVLTMRTLKHTSKEQR